MKPLGALLNPLFALVEKLTGMDLRHPAKQFTWLALGQVVSVATALLLAIGYAHFLPKDVYGTYKYVLSIFGILSAFALPGMSDAAQRGIAQGKDAMFWKTFRRRVEWAGLGALICAGIGVYYYILGQHLLGITFLAAVPFILVIDAFTHFNALLMGRQLFRETSYYSAAIQILAAFGIFFTILLTQNLVVIIVAYLALFVLLRGLALWRVIRVYPLNAETDDTALPYGAHMSVTNVINFSVGQLDSILLWHFLGAVPLAIYAFAEAAADQAQKAFKLVTTAMAFPKFAATETKDLKRALPRQVLIAHAPAFALAVIIALVVPFVYRFLFPAYLDSVPYAQVMALLLTFTPLRFISTAVNTKGSFRAIYSLSIVGSVLQVVFLFTFIPLWGIWGAIIATGLQQLLTNIFAFYLFLRM